VKKSRIKRSYPGKKRNGVEQRWDFLEKRHCYCLGHVSQHTIKLVFTLIIRVGRDTLWNVGILCT